MTERNQNVARIRDIIETSFKGIEGLVVKHLEETGRPDPLLETRSANDVCILRRELEQKAREAAKLKGVTLAHFSAFLKREYRENDYLWGRLDAAERLITLLVDDPDEPGMKPADPAECTKAFKAIVDAEQGALPTARDLIEHVRPQLEKMRRGGMVTESTPSRPTKVRP